MSMWNTAVLSGIVALLGVYSMIRAFRRPRLTLRAVRARVERPHGERTSRRVNSRTMSSRIGDALASGPLGRVVDEGLGKSLRLAGLTVPQVLGQVVAAVFVSTLTMAMLVSFLVTTGSVSPSPLLGLLCVGVVALFGWRVVADARARAIRRQRALRRVVNDFVQLLAIALTTNRSVEGSISFAADAGDGDGFDLLRQTISTAQPMGISVWDALTAMAETYDLPELRGLTTSLQRQAGVGVSVAATIRSEAKSMRDKQLSDLKDRADKANSNLSLPTMGMVFGMVMFLAYPIMRQISDAFA